MDKKTIFTTLALLGGTLTGCPSGGSDSTEVPRARKARAGNGSCGGAVRAEAGCSKKAPDPAPADVQEASSPELEEEEETEMLCGAPGEKRCA